MAKINVSALAAQPVRRVRRPVRMDEQIERLNQEVVLKKQLATPEGVEAFLEEGED